jgi:hypothetical protein
MYLGFANTRILLTDAKDQKITLRKNKAVEYSRTLPYRGMAWKANLMHGATSLGWELNRRFNTQFLSKGHNC